MKAKTFSYLLSLIALLAFAPFAFAEEPAVRGNFQDQAEPQRTLTGVIKEKLTDTQHLVVTRDDGQGDVKIALSDAVLITKDDQPVDRSELVPEVQVEVKVKGPEDAPEAVSIKIITKRPEPLLTP